MVRHRKKPSASRNSLRKAFFYTSLVLISFLLVQFITQVALSKLNQSVGRTNIVLLGDPIYLLSFPKNSNESVVTLAIPSDAYVSVPYGYGQYQLKSVVDLAKLEKKPNLVTDTVADTLGIYINGYVDFRGRNLDSEHIVEELKNLRFTLANLRGDFPTNLNLFDRLQLMRLAENSEPLSIINYDLLNAPLVLIDSKLPDGTTVKAISESALDSFLANKFELSQVRQQNLRIRVANTTDTAGVGQKFARYLSHLGGNVIRVDNASGTIASCRVEYRATTKKNILVDFLKKYFNCQIFEISEEGVDLTVYLGTDFGERWP